jgi:hypothetical protein
VARCLIIGCGCRGALLGRGLLERGHAVRGTTRRPERVAELADAGIEAVLADPDRLATLTPALDHVAVTYVLLGSAVGTAESVAALHGPRLEALMTRMVDTTVRGVVYEAFGSVDASLLAAGADRVRAACEDARIPYELLRAQPAEWPDGAVGAVERLLAPR